MATKTLYLKPATASGSPFFGGVAEETAPAANAATNGWTVAKGATSVPHWRSRLGVASAVASGAGSATDQISGTSVPTKGTSNTITTAGDSFVAGPYTGAFAATAWTFNFRMIATVVSSQAGRINCQVWKGPNADGTGATKLTATELNGSTITVTTTVANSTVNWTPASILTFSNEYLFIQVEWQVTTAGGSTTANVLFNQVTTTANTPTVVTSDFGTTGVGTSSGANYAKASGAISGANNPTFFTDFAEFFPSQISVSRASTAWDFDASGILQAFASNVGRAGYYANSSGTLVWQGAIIESQGKQYLPSNMQAYNTAQFATMGTCEYTPGDGYGCKLIENTANSYHTTYNNPNSFGVNGPQATEATISIYVRPLSTGSKRYLTIAVDLELSNGPSATFDPVLGTVTESHKCAALIEPAGNSSYRCSILCQPSSFQGFVGYCHFALSTTGTPYTGSTDSDGYHRDVYVGDGASGLNFWGQQMEFTGSSKPSSYIINTGVNQTSVVRSADILSSTDATLLAAKGWVVQTNQMVASTQATLLGINTAVGLQAKSSNVLAYATGTQATSNTATWSDQNRSALAWNASSRVSIDLNAGTVATSGTTQSTPTTLYIGNTNNGASDFLNGRIVALAAYSALTDAELAQVTSSTASYLITAPSFNLTAAQTLGALGQSVAATHPVSAVVAQTLGVLVQAATSTVLAQATTTQALGTLGQAATAAAVDSATVAQTLGALSQAAAATAPDAITVAQNLGALVQSAAATHPDTGTAAQTLGAIVQAATGGVIDAATAAQTLGALSQAATATVGSSAANAVVNQTLGSLGQAATATALDQATVNQTLGALSQAAAATHPDSATVAQSLGALTQSTTGTVSDSATAAQTLGAIVQAATGGVVDSATAAQTLGALAQAAAATALEAIAASQTLGALAQAATGTVTDAATVTQTLGALAQSVTGGVVDNAVVSQALGALVQSATATHAGTVNITAAQTLGNLAQALTGTAVDTATVAQSLGALGQVTAATHADTATTTQTLGAIVQALTGSVIDNAAVSQALGALNQTATATGTSGFTAAQTLGALVQAATGTVVSHAVIAQALGALTQATTGGPIDKATVSQTLGALGQSSTLVHVSFASVAQVLGALSQVATATGPGPANFAVNQILGALGQVAASSVTNRASAAQILGILGQASSARSTPPTHIRISGRLAARTVLQGKLGSRPAIRGTLE